MSTARIPPGVQCASNCKDESKATSFDLPSLGSKSFDQVNSSDLPYEYADVSEGLSQARMPPIVQSGSGITGNEKTAGCKL